MKLLAMAFTLLTLPACAQTQVPSRPTQPEGSITSHPGWPPPASADVSSPEALVAAVYNVISGAKDAPRNWNRMRSLFIPDARLIPTRELAGTPDSRNPNTDITPLTIDGYIARSTARTSTAGFFEHGTTVATQTFGNIVHIWSAYESRHAETDATPFASGVNSFQILKDGGRYWIVNIFWDAAPTPDLAATKSLTSGFIGDWTGQLEYRDYSTNAQTFLPTWVTLTPGPELNSVQFQYTYDDGPNKTVRETTLLTLSPSTSKATLATLGDKPDSATYDVQGLADFTKLDRGTLVLTGPGKENNKAVDVRITLTLRRNLYTLRKETKLPGEEFKFRDAYTFTRSAPPTAR